MQDRAPRSERARQLLAAFCAVRLAEHELFADSDPAEIATATRWKY